MIFKQAKQLNHIGAIKIFMKPNYNLGREECSTIPKYIGDKYITLTRGTLEIRGALCHKTSFHQFFKSLTTLILGESIR